MVTCHSTNPAVTSVTRGEQTRSRLFLKFVHAGAKAAGNVGADYSLTFPWPWQGLVPLLPAQAAKGAGEGPCILRWT
jgi:hypothetical protein